MFAVVRGVIVVWMALVLTAAVACAHGGGHGLQFKQAEGGTAEGAVMLPPEVQNRIGLKVAPVAVAALSDGLSLTGRIEAIPERTAPINAPLTGRVIQVAVHQGQTVRAGQVLAVLDSPEIRELAVQVRRDEAVLQADLPRLLAQVEYARSAYRREDALFRRGVSARREVELARAELIRAESELAGARSKLRLVRGALEARLAQLGSDGGSDARVVLKAPRSGFVVSQNATGGKAVEAGEVLFTLVDLGEVWASADVFEKDLPRVQRGQLAEIALVGVSGPALRGSVSVIDPLLDAEGRTVKVRSVLANPTARLKPGMFARIRLVTGAARNVPVVPRLALVRAEGRDLVYVKNGDRFEPAEVQLGADFGDAVEVKDGLFEGDEVVVERAYQLRAQQLRAPVQESPAASEAVVAKAAGQGPPLWLWPLLCLGMTVVAFGAGVAITRRQMVALLSAKRE
jgi:cobalt-zinc-cadmium efflux system membrane fusion protein